MLLRLASTLSVLSLVGAAMGLYYIDDTDPSIKYSGPWMPLNASFEPITWANASECFNETFTVGQGYTNEETSLTIPFTGTGISLFVAYNNRLGLNASITLDNNFTTINWFILDTDYTTPTVTTYNATLYNIENLDNGNHHLVVTLQDYRGNQSDMMFDYAAVNGTRPDSSSSGSSDGKKLGAGIGGGLGALAVIAAIAMLFLFSRRRSATSRKISSMELGLIDPDAKDPSMFRRAGSNISATFRPSHNRHQSSFSQSSTSPISPVKPAYSNFLGQKQHPFQKIDS